MNTRVVCDNHSKLSVKLPQFARHEKLAFIERVCALLIESRFDNGHAEAWEHWCSGSENDLDETIFEKPRFAGPAAPAKRRSLPATNFPEKGTPGFLAKTLSNLFPFISTFSAVRSARGSPPMIRCRAVHLSPLTFDWIFDNLAFGTQPTSLGRKRRVSTGNGSDRANPRHQ